MSDLKFTTVASGMETLKELRRLADTDWMTCRIKIVVPFLDTIVDAELPLQIERTRAKANWVSVDGDRTYRTRARFRETGRSFAVDVVIHSRQADFGATIVMAGEALTIANEN